MPKRPKAKVEEPPKMFILRSEPMSEAQRRNARGLVRAVRAYEESQHSLTMSREIVGWSPHREVDRRQRAERSASLRRLERSLGRR